jgi:hypothetical protein
MVDGFIQQVKAQYLQIQDSIPRTPNLGKGEAVDVLL